MALWQCWDGPFLPPRGRLSSLLTDSLARRCCRSLVGRGVTFFFLFAVNCILLFVFISIYYDLAFLQTLHVGSVFVFLFLIKATFRVLCKYSDGGSRDASLKIKKLTIMLNPFCSHSNSFMMGKWIFFWKPPQMTIYFALLKLGAQAPMWWKGSWILFEREQMMKWEWQGTWFIPENIWK